MNYKRIYDNIINNAKSKNRNKKLDNQIYERHHIIPKCLGGDNNLDNLILLTPKEHFICHQLLCEIYPTNDKLKFAFWGMCNQKNGDSKRDYKTSSTTYQYAKKLQYEANSKLHKGKKISDKQKNQFIINCLINNPSKKGELNHNFGKPRTNEVINKISKTKLENPEMNGNYKGDYITPFGIFKSTRQASDFLNNSISSQIIAKRCKTQNLKQINHHTIIYNKDLTINDINKTFKDLGWGFQPL